MRPPASTAIRGMNLAPRCRSWSTATIVRPSRSLRSTRNSITSTWWRMSRCTVGSSSTMIGAPCATATASSTAAVRRATARARSGRSGARARRDRSRSRWRHGRAPAAHGAGPRAAVARAPRSPRRGLQSAGDLRHDAIRRAIAPRESLTSGSFPRRTSPATGVTIPVMTRMSVDLPAPLGPTTAIRSPGCTRNVTSWSTVRPP